MLITKRLSRLRYILIDRERCSPFRTNIKKPPEQEAFLIVLIIFLLHKLEPTLKPYHNVFLQIHFQRY